MRHIRGLKNRCDMRRWDNFADLAVTRCQNSDKPPVPVNNRAAAVSWQSPRIGMNARPRAGICRGIERKVTVGVNPGGIAPLVEGNDMQLLGHAIHHHGRLVRNAINTFHPQDYKISWKIMRQRRCSPDSPFTVTRHDPRVILGHMPVGNNKAVGNHRS